MSATRHAAVLAALLLAGCGAGTPSATPQPTAPPTAAPASAATPAPSPPPTTTPAPSASVAPVPTATPAPSAVAIQTILVASARLDEAGLRAALRGNQDASRGCARAEQMYSPEQDVNHLAPMAAVRRVDQELSCLEDIGLAWADYVGSPTEENLTVVRALYDYAVTVFGDPGRTYFNAALVEMARSLASEPAPPVATKSLNSLITAKRIASLGTTSAQKAALRTVHDQLHDAYAANLATLIVAIRAKCGEDCRATLTEADLWVSGVNVLAACQTYQIDCQLRNVWQMYLATGDKAFYNILVRWRDWEVATWKARYGDVKPLTNARFVDGYLRH